MRTGLYRNPPRNDLAMGERFRKWRELGVAQTTCCWRRRWSRHDGSPAERSRPSPGARTREAHRQAHSLLTFCERPAPRSGNANPRTPLRPSGCSCTGSQCSANTAAAASAWRSCALGEEHLRTDAERRRARHVGMRCSIGDYGSLSSSSSASTTLASSCVPATRSSSSAASEGARAVR